MISNEFIKAAKELIDSVSFDMNGMIVGNNLVGGHGGLISKETLQKCDELRRIIWKLENNKV